jgi:hypothetical protein
MSIKTNTIRVAAAIADKKQVTLYLEDGDTLIIKQTDHKLQDILDAIIPITQKGEIAVISLSDFSVYAAFEQKTGGVTKFFKIAKSKIKGFFGANPHEEDAPVKLSGETQQALINAVSKVNEDRTDEQATNTPLVTEAEPANHSVESVMKHGIPMDHTDEAGPDEVVVAVIDNKTVIAGVDRLKPLIAHAVRSNSPQAVQAFLAKCAAMPNRQHSVDDLMRFLEKGDLPLTEDGSIIAYKLLNTQNHANGTFADVHSGNVYQSVGDYVCVDESLVDLNRRNDCSNGLHIARRGYLRSFTGDACVLCKIEPEDVMVVPHNVRVKGYHILALLSKAGRDLLMQNKPMTGEESDLRVVYEAIKGNHIGRLREVRIRAQRGRDILYTKLRGGQKVVEHDYTATPADLSKAAALDDSKNAVLGVSPKEINKRLNDEYEASIKTAPPMMTEEPKKKKAPATPAPVPSSGSKTPKASSAIDDLLLDYNTAPEGNAKVVAARKIVALKKAKKKGWDKLGISDAKAQEILEYAQTSAQAAATTPAPAPKAKPKAAKPKTAKAASAPVKAAKASVKKTPASKAKVKTATPPIAAKTKAEQARELFKAGDMNALKAFKKSAKKGWSILGFTDAEIKKIEG